MQPFTLLRLAAFAALCVSAAAQSTPGLTVSAARIQAAVDAGQAGSAQTHQALAARRAMLLEVFRNDPASARANALPLATRQALLTADPTTAPLLESELTKTGELAVSVADNWADGTSSTRYALHTAAGEWDLALPAGVLATVPMNHHLVTVHGLALDGVVAADTLTEASPADAAACALPVAPHANDLAGNTTAPLTCSTFGNQRIAVLMVKFPAATPAFPTGLDQAAYWNQVLFGSNPSVNTYWQEVSQGQTYATGDVYGPFQLSAQYDCTTTNAMQTAAIAAAAGTVDFTQYNRVIIVYPVTSCTFGGLGNVGCVSATSTINHQYSVVWLPISSSYRADFSYPQMWGGTSHELGHNLGLNHANTLDFGGISLGPLDFSTTNPGTVVGTGAGTATGSNLSAVNTEYGDTFDVMGYPWTSGGPYNAVHRSKTLGWISGLDERDVTASGSFTLVPAESASGLRALHVLRDASATSWLWVEFHQSTGYYESGNYSAHIGYGDTETTGAQIHYETPLGQNAYTYLLDMTPATSATTGNNDFYDGTLAPGKSWSDPYSLLTITAGTQTSAGLGITIRYDTPCATVALSGPSVPAAGGAGTVTLAAPAYCNWTVSSNATWITFPGATSGAGPAVIPYTASANTTSLQRNTYITAQRQSLALLQAGTGITLSGISPNSGNSIAGSATPFTLSFADALGSSDLTQLNVDFTGFGSVDCQVAVVPSGANAYLYLLNGTAYTSGVLAGSAGTISSPSCTLSAAGSSYKASGGTGSVTLGLTFTSSFPAEHNILGNAYGNAANTGSIPLGVWSVVAPSVLPATSTTLTVSPANASPGQTVTLTATVGPGTPTGTVFFVENGASVANPAMNNGVATFSTNTLTPGPHLFSAVYSGDIANASSASPVVIVTIAASVTTTTLTPSANSLVYGVPVTLAAKVTPASATGGITFSDVTSSPASTVGSGTLTAGGAFLTLSNLPVGTHLLAASYAGDANNSSSTSAPVSVTVTQIASGVVLTPSAYSVAVGSSLTLTAAVTPATATGTVTFYSAAINHAPIMPIGTGTVANGLATFTTSSLSAGSYYLTAGYGGDTNDASGGSNQIVVTIMDVPGATTTTLTGSAASILPSGSVTLTAHVIAGSGLTQPGGTVSFGDGGAVLASVTLNAGSASYTASGLALGTHSFSVAYAGSATAFSGSVSNAFPVVVARAPVALGLTTSAGTVFPNGSVLMTATATSPSGLTPAGSLTFTDGSASLATVALVNGSASFTAAGLATGSHALGATLVPSNDFMAGTSSQVPLAVQDFALSLPGGSATLNAGTGESLPLTIAPGASGFAAAVALSCSGAPAQTICSVSPGSLTPGATPGTATLTLTTTARPSPSPGWMLLGLSPGLLAFRRRNRARLAGLLTACPALAMLTFASGCGQGNFTGIAAGGGTPAGTYSLTITGTATGATVLTHSCALSLTVK